MTLEERLIEFALAKCNIDVLVEEQTGDDPPHIGVRIRPWTAKDKDWMVLGSGYTLEVALDDAYTKAEQGRWEPIDWSARPWTDTSTNRRPSTIGPKAVRTRR